MMKEQVIDELKGYISMIESFDKDSAQDADALHAYLIQLTNYMARANFLMAEWSKVFREEKRKAYLSLKASEAAQGNKNLSPLLAKDYVNSCCSESGYVYDLAERTSRLCTHTGEFVRSILSSLKSERQFAGYA